MSKRVLVAFAWFAATWVGYELLWSLTDVPRIAGPVIAFAVAGCMTLDPFGLFWPRTGDTSSRAISPAGFESPVSPAR